jgi:hypothetical protein
LGDQAGKTFTETVSNNPLLVAGIGLVVGGLIASAIPRLRMENEVLGGAANDLKNRARDAVARGVETAKDAATAAFSGAADVAKDQGLNADALATAAKDVGQRARKVAEAAASSFETPSHNKH